MFITKKTKHIGNQYLTHNNRHSAGQSRASTICFLIILFLLQPIYASPYTVEIRKKAKEALATKSYSKLAKLLKDKELPEGLTQGPKHEFWLMRGLGRLHSKNPLGAKKDFEAILAENPNADRVRMELALANNMLGRKEQALREYRKALNKKTMSAQSPGSSLQAHLNKASQFIQKQRHPLSWSLGLGIGMLYDTNVNAGPSADQVLVNNNLLPVGNTTKPQEDWAWQAALNSGLYYKLDESWTLYALLGYSHLNYNEENFYDTDSTSISLGITHIEGSWNIRNSLNWNYTTLNSKQYYQRLSFLPQISRKLAQDLSLRLYGGVGINSYQNIENRTVEREGENYHLGAAIRKQCIRGDWYVEARIYGIREDSDIETHEYWAYGAGIRAFQKLPWGFRAIGDINLIQSNYDAEVALFGKHRDQAIINLSANISRELGLWGLEVSLGYTYTDNDSEIDFYTYDRHRISLQFQKKFGGKL